MLKICKDNAAEAVKLGNIARAMRSPRIAIQQGAQLQRIAFDLAMSIAGESDPERLEAARMRAQSITGLLRSWTDVRQQVRVEQGKPSPGSLKPESKAKLKKPKRSLNCGLETTTGSVPSPSISPPTPQEGPLP